MAKLQRAITCYNSTALSTAIRNQIVAMAPKYLDGCINDDGAYFIDNLPASYPLRYFNLTDLPNNDTQMAWGLARAAANGIADPEDIMLHFAADTVVNILGTDYLIPGYGAGTASTKAAARVPLYYKFSTLTGQFPRVMTNFSTSAVRQVWREYAIEQVLTVPYASGKYPRGLWLDNATDTTFNVDVVTMAAEAQAGRDVWSVGVVAGGGSWAATGAYDYRIVPSTSLGDGISSKDYAATITTSTQHVQLDWSHTGTRTYKIYRKPHASSWTSGNWRIATVTGVNTYIDNGQAPIAGSGGPTRAGEILEAAAGVTFMSPEFADWKWNSGHGLWIKEFKDIIAGAPSWLGGRQAKIVANVANHPPAGASWTARYSNFNGTGARVCDGVFREFSGAPIRETGIDEPNNMYTTWAAAAAAGLDVWDTGYNNSISYPSGTTLVGGATLTAFEVMSGIIGTAWLVRGSTTMIQGYANTWSPADAEWQFMADAIWDLDLGAASGAPTVLASGTVAGNAYKVWGREFAQGYVTVRFRNGGYYPATPDHTEPCDSTMDVSVTLPAGTWNQVTALDGTTSGSATTTFTHGNARAYIFKRSGAPAADTTPPSAISTLAAGASSSSAVDLSWNAVGDDGLTGAASVYDVRYSTSAINAGNFNSANVYPQTIIPAAEGDPEELTVDGLLPSTTYYFAVKAGDEVPNWSAISNVVSKATLATADVTPPVAISNLTATSLASTPASGGAPQVLLSWTAPSDASGCAEYDIRIGTATITSGNFGTPGVGSVGDANNHIQNVPSPGTAGQIQSFLIPGRYRTDSGIIILPSIPDLTTLYFAIKTKDAAGNWSAISNVASVTTGALGDFTAPDAVSDLSVVSSTNTSVTLSLTNPGDPETSAAMYDVRYSKSPITSGNFATATQATGESTPTTVQAIDTIVVNGLSQATIYYFAMKTADVAGNWSAMSNVASGATKASPPDPTPATNVTVASRVTFIPLRAEDTQKPLLKDFPQYCNLYWNDKWGDNNDTTPGRDQILRVLANHKVVILNESTTNPGTSLGHELGVPDAASRLRAMNEEIIVGIAGNAWSTNVDASVYWPFRTALRQACIDNDWWLKFDNGAQVYSDGAAAQYPMIDLTHPGCRNWFADNVRRYFMNLGYDQYSFWFADEMQSSLAAVPSQGGKASWEIATFNNTTTTRTKLMSSSGDTAGRAAQDAMWTSANTATMARMPDVLVMPNGTTAPSPTTIGRMCQGIYPSTKPDNELDNIYAHFANTRRPNRLMYYHTEWGSAMAQWLNQVNLTDEQLVKMGLISANGAYLAQGSWATYRTACQNIACFASIFDGLAHLENALIGNFRHPWQYFGYAPGVFGVPVEYLDANGSHQPRIIPEKINQGNTNKSGIYWREFTKATVAFNWQWGNGTPTALTWSKTGLSIAANTGAVVFK